MVSYKDVQEAFGRIRPHVHETPLAGSSFFSKITGAQCELKLENMQKTGSFKARGAFNAALGIKAEERGIVTASSGNHGQAVAYAGRTLGMNVTVVVAENVSRAKAAAIREYGAQIVSYGTTTAERQKRALELAEEREMAYLSSFDDPRVIAGQGTCAVEVLSQNPDAGVIFAPISGGGLVSGTGLIKEKNPGVTVIGVEPELCASMKASLESGEIVEVLAGDTVADGLKALRPGGLTFALAQRYVDEVISVSEEEIIWACKALLQRVKVLAEPSGAVAVAGMLKWRHRLRGRKPIAIVSGGNVDLQDLAKLLTIPDREVRHA